MVVRQDDIDATIGLTNRTRQALHVRPIRDIQNFASDLSAAASRKLDGLLHTLGVAARQVNDIATGEAHTEIFRKKEPQIAGGTGNQCNFSHFSTPILPYRLPRIDAPDEISKLSPDD
jgi:hypothetical protein